MKAKNLFEEVRAIVRQDMERKDLLAQIVRREERREKLLVDGWSPAEAEIKLKQEGFDVTANFQPTSDEVAAARQRVHARHIAQATKFDSECQICINGEQPTLNGTTIREAVKKLETAGGVAPDLLKPEPKRHCAKCSCSDGCSSCLGANAELPTPTPKTLGPTEEKPLPQQQKKEEKVSYQYGRKVTEEEARAAYEVISSVEDPEFIRPAMRTLKDWAESRFGDVCEKLGLQRDGSPPRCPDNTKCRKSWQHLPPCEPYSRTYSPPPATQPSKPAPKPEEEGPLVRALREDYEKNAAMHVGHSSPEAIWNLHCKRCKEVSAEFKRQRETNTHGKDCTCNGCEWGERADAKQKAPFEVKTGSKWVLVMGVPEETCGHEWVSCLDAPTKEFTKCPKCDCVVKGRTYKQLTEDDPRVQEYLRAQKEKK